MSKVQVDIRTRLNESFHHAFAYIGFCLHFVILQDEFRDLHANAWFYQFVDTVSNCCMHFFLAVI